MEGSSGAHGQRVLLQLGYQHGTRQREGTETSGFLQMAGLRMSTRPSQTHTRQTHGQVPSASARPRVGAEREAALGGRGRRRRQSSAGGGPGPLPAVVLRYEVAEPRPVGAAIRHVPRSAAGPGPRGWGVAGRQRQRRSSCGRRLRKGGKGRCGLAASAAVARSLRRWLALAAAPGCPARPDGWLSRVTP